VSPAIAEGGKCPSCDGFGYYLVEDSDERIPCRACTDPLPAFEPFMLRGLSFEQAMNSMRVTGCAVRRPHWCSPVLVMDGDKVLIDDDGEMSAYRSILDERSATDWEMVERPIDEPAPPSEEQSC
jgi:hypothetical protein